MSDQPFIRVMDVHKTYALGDSEMLALRGVSVDVQPGEFVALCGSSGSGKSTLLILIAGLDFPTRGEIRVGPHPLNQLSENQLAQFRSRELGFVFQTFNIIPVLSSLENVEYPLLKLGLPSKEREARAKAALESVGLGRFLKNRPNQLSGGQRQRVAIARAVVHRPKLIIADEPTANLDRKTGSEILALLDQLNRETGVTIVVATHDPEVMAKTRREIHLSDGLIQSDGQAREARG